MGQKGYCCALLLGLCLLLGATELVNAQNDNETTMMMTDTPTTLPSPVNISQGNNFSYPSEAIVVLSITFGDGYTRANISDLGFILQYFVLAYCGLTNETDTTDSMGSGSSGDFDFEINCTSSTIEGSPPGDYEVVFIGYSEDAENDTAELQFVVQTPLGAIDFSDPVHQSTFGLGLQYLFCFGELPVEVTLVDFAVDCPETTPESTTVEATTVTTEKETTKSDDGVPIPVIVGVVVGVGVPLIIIVTVVIVVVVVVVVMKKSSATAVTKIAPTPSKSEPPTTSTPHGNTVELEKFSKSDKV